MGSYSDESYTPSYSRRSTPIFKPDPTPDPEPVKKTARATKIKPPVTNVITRPKGKVNLVLKLDLTGSMGAWRENLKEKSIYLYKEITTLLPELAGDMEIAFVGFGDHCDGSCMIQPTAFSNDVATLKAHIESLENVSGGDIPEAIECLFKEMNAWDIEGTNTIAVLVTDSYPHGVGRNDDDYGCPDSVDWRKELDALKKKIRAFYVVSCADNSVIKRRQKAMVDEEHFIELGGDARRLTNIIHGIVAKEVGELEKYFDHLTKTRGKARTEEVKTFLKTKIK